MTKKVENKQNQELYKPLEMEFKGEAGKRVLLASVRRVMQRHKKEIQALADKWLIYKISC